MLPSPSRPFTTNMERRCACSVAHKPTPWKLSLLPDLNTLANSSLPRLCMKDHPVTEPARNQAPHKTAKLHARHPHSCRPCVADAFRLQKALGTRVSTLWDHELAHRAPLGQLTRVHTTKLPPQDDRVDTVVQLDVGAGHWKTACVGETGGGGHNQSAHLKNNLVGFEIKSF